MKTLVRFLVIAAVVVGLGHRGVIIPACAAADKSPEPVKVDSSLTIERASYGTEDGRIEVAELFRPLVAHGMLFLRATWGLGPDPKPGTVKDVVIVYRQNGVEATATFTQRQDILLPPPTKALTIIKAQYGVDDSRLDVTEAVRAAMTGDTLRFPAKWSIGRVDPAAGKIKTLEIIYFYEGTANTVYFSQKDPVVLP